MLKITLQWIQVLFFPICEIIIIRNTLHELLGSNLMRLGIHATDFYLPFALGITLVFFIIQKKEPLTIQLNKRLLSINLALIFILVQFKTFFSPPNFSAEKTALTLLILPSLILFTSLFIFISFHELLQKIRAHQIRFLIGIIALCFLLFYPLILELFWVPLSTSTAILSAWVLNLFGLKVETLNLGGFFRMWSPYFSATMVMGCSGLEGIFFFIYSCLLLQMIDPLSFKRFPTLWIYLLGIFWMFFLNIVRLTTFFSIAAYLENHLRVEQGKEFYEWAVHTNIGWLLYFTGLIFFFSAMKKPKYHRECNS